MKLILSVKALQKFSILILLLLAVSFIAFNSVASQPLEKQRLPLPPKTGVITAKGDSEPAWSKHTVTIPKNGSLSEALDEVGLSQSTAFEIKNTKNSQRLTRLDVGDKLDIWIDQNHQLQQIDYPKTQSTHYRLTKGQNGFNIETIRHPVETKLVTSAGTIQHSFYSSGQDAGLSAKTIMNLADIFAWEIDFIRQLRPGDPFKVIYEKHYINGKFVGDGDILAAEVTTNGDEKHTAFLLRTKQGKNIGYYDQDRHNLKKAFLRNPVDYVRITSRYKPMRYHPVLKKWRAHRGVDYGGPIGTPIHATGDGQIIKRAWSKSYGRVIYIKHISKYTTVYAHMSKFGKYKKGQWIRQGDIIGYIGQTGLATGPHLHYEFRKNGHHVDPLKVKLPNASPVPRKFRSHFVAYAKLMQAQMNRLNPQTQLAGNFE